MRFKDPYQLVYEHILEHYAPGDILTRDDILKMAGGTSGASFEVGTTIQDVCRGFQKRNLLEKLGNGSFVLRSKRVAEELTKGPVFGLAYHIQRAWRNAVEEITEKS